MEGSSQGLKSMFIPVFFDILMEVVTNSLGMPRTQGQCLVHLYELDVIYSDWYEKRLVNI